MIKNKLFEAMASTAIVVGIVVYPAISYGDVEPELEERQKIVAEVQRRLADKNARSMAMEAGLERSTLCATCHGADGNAKKSEYPNLASQNPAYIIEQMSKFKDGRRKNFVMQALVRNFSMEDQINLAVYFSSHQLKPVAEANPVLAAKGERKYQEVCAMCHGEGGRGEKGYARLAGQQIGYVTMNLKRFRSNALKAGNFDETKRTNARMEQVTQFLSDEDIEGLAHYIALIK
ncbi:MAG: c-type cytochrome [Pseudomonadota bacterium]